MAENKSLYQELMEIISTTHDTEVIKFLNFLKEGTPFAFARFNDGEMGGIEKVGTAIARHDQIVNKELQDKLIEALQHQQENYWVGIVCSECYPHFKELSDKYTDDTYEYFTQACVLTNRNWLKFIQEFPKVIPDNKLIWYGGNNQDVQKLNDIGIFPKLIIHTKTQDSWSEYEKIKETSKEFADGDVVCMSIGPLSRVLAAEWFNEYTNVTFIDIGSTFDPFTRDVKHNCHKGWMETGTNLCRKCKECN